MASEAHVAALRKRLSHDSSIAVFSESESLNALGLLLSRPPKILALDSSVVRTARGAQLVSQLKDRHVDVRVLTNDSDSIPMLLSHPDVSLQTASHPIDACGTRGAPRFPMTNQEVVIDGSRSELVNLSISGAQVVLPARVQPNQSVRFILHDGASQIRFRAQVAWASIELVLSAVRYRAGIAFTDPDRKALEKFCQRYGRA